MASKVKLGAVVTVVVALGAMLAIGFTFVENANPYVDVEQALANTGDGLHLLGSIDKKSVHSNPLQREISFDLVDAKGKTMHVDYHGEAISNINEADKVVAVGHVKDGVFLSDKLNIKCPSKYEDKRPDAGKPA
ncbi:MAG TPA: cytochrome c maturation protein CcmE [Fimbriimonadaceae bacterium]|nr:cytochrome c maturation protein CcmE [Fimbriimonadaceae bacterium]